MPAGATYEPVASTNGDGSSTSITFSSISGYSDLKIIVRGAPSTATYIGMRFNGDSSALYTATYLNANGVTVLRQADASGDRNYLHYRDNASTTQPSMWIVDLIDYRGATFKSAIVQASMDYNGTGEIDREVTLYRSTTAITSITINTVSGALPTSFNVSIYGITRA